MTESNRVAIFIEMAPLIFLIYQIDHYNKRLSEANTKKESVFLKTKLLKLKKSLPKHLN